MSSELTENFLNHRKSYMNHFDQAFDIIQQIKIKNEHLNQYIDVSERDKDYMKELSVVRGGIQKKIEEVKDIILNLEKQSGSFKHKQDLKKLKDCLNKEVEKFQTIMKTIVKFSFQCSHNQSQIDSNYSSNNASLIDTNGKANDKLLNINHNAVDSFLEPFNEPITVVTHKEQINSTQIKQQQEQQQHINRLSQTNNNVYQVSNNNNNLNQKVQYKQEPVKVQMIEKKQQQTEQKQIQQSQQQLQQLQSINNFDLEQELLLERQKDIDKIEKDLIVVNNLMKEIGMEAINQGEQLDILETNVNSVKDDVSQANQEINQANTTSKSSKKKWIYLTMLLILVAAGITAFVVLFDWENV